MTSFLVFRLWGPMVAWGDIAVGERRPAFAHPTKSGALGLVAASLGLKRDAAELPALEAGYGYACRVDSSGSLLSDYHTAQVMPGPQARKTPPRSRKEELGMPRAKLDTTLSRRDYHCDALARVCLWSEGERAPFPLEALAEALAAPRFVLYLGRKSCPPGVPLQPQFVQAANPVEALDAAGFAEVPAIESTSSEGAATTYRWEGDWDGLRPEQSVIRRDQGRSRSAWQFIERVEHIAQRRRSVHAAEQD